MKRTLAASIAALLITTVACTSTMSPTPGDPNATCTFSVTMFMFPDRGAPAPTGTPFATFFGNNVLVAGSAVYFVDVNATPNGCGTAWTAVSGNTGAVQVSPASGRGVGRVEIFIPPNTGANRSSTLTVAGLSATITQNGQ